MGMTPLSEVPLESFRASVLEITTYLTVKVKIEAVQLVQPVRDGLAVPAQGQVLRVVGNRVIFLITVVIYVILILIF